MSTSSVRLRWMDAVIAAGESIDTYARAVAFALMSHMNRGGSCKVSVRRLAREAKCTTNVVMNRIERFEDAGLMKVDRRHRSASTFHATPPEVASVSPEKTDESVLPHETVSPEETDGQNGVPSSVSPHETGPDPSVSPERQTVSPGETQPYEPSSFPTSTSPTTSVGEERGEEPPKGKVTPQRIFTEMARRRLGLAREQNAAWAPEEGCDPRREAGYLRTEAAAFRDQYGFELDNLIAKWKPDQPAPAHQKWRNDPDWYVWKLDKALAKRDWMQPTWQETREKLDREQAEYEAACAAADPAEVERGRQAARDLAERLRRENEERRRHKLRLVTNEEQVPA